MIRDRGGGGGGRGDEEKKSKPLDVSSIHSFFFLPR
jgi:hypothetical protein